MLTIVIIDLRKVWVVYRGTSAIRTDHHDITDMLLNMALSIGNNKTQISNLVHTTRQGAIVVVIAW